MDKEQLKIELERLDSLERDSVKDYEKATNDYMRSKTLKTRIKILLQKQAIYKQQLENLRNDKAI